MTLICVEEGISLFFILIQRLLKNLFYFVRFLLTRDLIVLQQIMLSCGSPHEVPLEATEIIHSTFLPRCVVLNHSYFIISWINETHSTAPPNDSLEQGKGSILVS